MANSSRILKKIILELLEKNNRNTLERILNKVHIGDLFTVFRQLSHKERIKLFQVIFDINTNIAINIFYDLDEDIQIDILRNIDKFKALIILLSMSTGELSKIVDKLPKSLQKELLNKLDVEDRKTLEKIISYGEDNIAPLISDEFVAVSEYRTVEETLNILKTVPEDVELLYVYIVDEKNHLVGVVSIKELLTAPSNAIVKDIANDKVIYITDISTKEEAIEIFKNYDLFILPVVSHNERILIGVIYIDDILDTLVEKTSESIFQLAGSGEEELFYSNQILKIVKLRAKWLVFSTSSEIMVALIIIFFARIFLSSDILNSKVNKFVNVEDFIIILSFIPLLAAMTGNINSQSYLIIMRGLITGRLQENLKDFVFFLLREIKVAFIFAFFISTTVSITSYAVYPHHLLWLVVGLALFINIILASFFGGLLPFLLYKLRKEPVYISNPLLLSINDIFSILVYLAIAYFLLKETSIIHFQSLKLLYLSL